MQFGQRPLGRKLAFGSRKNSSSKIRWHLYETDFWAIGGYRFRHSQPTKTLQNSDGALTLTKDSPLESGTYMLTEGVYGALQAGGRRFDPSGSTTSLLDQQSAFRDRLRRAVNCRDGCSCISGHCCPH